MIPHDAQTLMSLKVLEGSARGASGVYDIGIALAGEGLFGARWTPRRRAGYFDHAPLINMSLGRLERIGLVRRSRFPVHTGTSRFHSWRLAPAGRDAAVELLEAAGFTLS